MGSYSPTAVPSLGDGSFGAFTFFAREHEAEECNSHGLPLTPNTVTMSGRFQELKEIHHVNLCVYLDLVKCDGERLICVSEYYTDSLENRLTSDHKQHNFTHSFSVQLARELTEALVFLHDRGMAASSLSPQSILFNSKGCVKLFNYGFYHVTDHCKLINFSVESPRYISPEMLLSTNTDDTVAIAMKSNIWSLGIILLEVFMECHKYPDLFLKNGLATLFTCLLRIVKNHQRGSVSPLISLLDTHGLGDKPMGTNLKDFLELCLTPLPSKRATAVSLLTHVYLKPSKAQPTPQCASLRDPFKEISLDVSKIELSSFSSHSNTTTTNMSLSDANSVMNEDHLTSCSMKEVYFLWGLAGGDLLTELTKASLIHKKPPILKLPCVIANNIPEMGYKQDMIQLFDGHVVKLSMEQLKQRLESKTVEDYYPLLPDPDEQTGKYTSVVTQTDQLNQLSKLPLLIKEKDIDYQFHRLILFRRLLEAYPYTEEMIITESIIDVCPLMRGPIWATLLKVHGDIITQYNDIDKESILYNIHGDIPRVYKGELKEETIARTDRQVSVDVPRCHQYDMLLASSLGHIKFTRLLKAWVMSHPSLVYWQGLDSLCAPFLALNFNNEALAYASLCSFIDKYLPNFFLKDNSAVMQEYLMVFSQLIAYHDSEVFNHLDNIGFFPDLYAIPWFLTMFTHVFPLNKIYHLWDTLLLGNTSFPLFVGVSIMLQLRTELLNSGFNDCIMTFSDLPDIDIHQCVTDAVRLYQTTPPSLSVRCYDKYPDGKNPPPSETHPDPIPINNDEEYRYLGPPEARKRPLPLEVLRMESSPQLSAHDLVTLCKLEGVAIHYAPPTRGATPPFTGKNPKEPLLWRQLETNSTGSSSVIVIDIRSKEEYAEGHMKSSCNLPHSETFTASGELNQSSNVERLIKHSWDVIVIVAGKGDPGPTFARQLVRLSFSHVCLLHGGAGVLRSLGLLSTI